MHFVKGLANSILTYVPNMIHTCPDWKSGKVENILISLIFVWLEVEKWRDGKNEFE